MDGMVGNGHIAQTLRASMLLVPISIAGVYAGAPSIASIQREHE